MILNVFQTMMMVLLFGLLYSIIIDKLVNEFRITKFIVDIWKSIFALIRRIGNWRGIISLLITWIVLSGIGALIIGIIIGSKILLAIGAAIFLFWAGPFTPLIPLTIAISLVIQRYIFRDKSVSLNIIKETFKEVRNK